MIEKNLTSLVCFSVYCLDLARKKSEMMVLVKHGFGNEHFPYGLAFIVRGESDYSPTNVVRLSLPF